MKWRRICALVLVSTFWALMAANGYSRTHENAMDNPFPEYPEIQPNIQFWKKIYSQYSTAQGVIHDKRHLDIIYTVVSVKQGMDRRTRKSNRKKIKNLKRKYKRILKKLARGRKPETPLEKKVYDLFEGRKDPLVLKNAWKNLRFQLGQKDRFQKGVIRSGAYLKEIKKIMRDMGLPEDLAYLPHVESSFNYQAYSKFGAAGIWQFTRGTGKKYMRVDYTVDERRDPILSTYAAASHLKNNFRRLESWPCAVTAYNHGVNGILRALKKTGGDYITIVKHYNGRLFGFASRNFYAEFLAAREIAKNYRDYFGNLSLSPPVQRISVPLSGYIAVSKLADFFQIMENEIAKINPALRKPVFSGQKYIPKGYTLFLPKGQTTQSLANFRIPKHLYRARQKPSRFYRVQQGDTAWKIARRQGVSLRNLVLANQLDSRATVYVGQHLRIPQPEERLILASIAKEKLSGPLLDNRKTPKTPKPKAIPVQTEAPAEARNPAVEKLSEPVQKQAAIPAEAAVKLPEKKETTKVPLDPFQPVSVWETSKVDQSTESPESEPEFSASTESTLAFVNPAILTGHLEVEKIFEKGARQYGIIQVEPEETLGHYADWLGIPTQRIRNINRLRFGTPIHTGQKLKIPFSRVDKDTFLEKRYEYHKGIEEDFFSVYQVEQVNTYRVKKGDNIWNLCSRKFELPLWLIRKYNPELDLNGLRYTNRIQVPVIKKIEG